MSIDNATPEEWDRAAAAERVKQFGYDVCESNEVHPEKLTLGDVLDTIPSFDFDPRIEYKFRENELINELQSYIDKTYDQHYAGGKIQATEDIIDDGHGTGFCIGNAKKYLKRYGKKGETPAEWRKDIIKVLHYGLIQLYVHDLEHGNTSN